jgi:hypothetical protein
LPASPIHILRLPVYHSHSHQKSISSPLTGLLGNLTNSLDNALTGGDEQKGQGGLLGGVTGALGKTVDGVGNAAGQTVDGLGNTVGKTTEGVGNTAGGVTNGVGNTAGGLLGGQQDGQRKGGLLG